MSSRTRIVLAAIVLAACGKPAEAESPDAEATSEEPTPASGTTEAGSAEDDEPRVLKPGGLKSTDGVPVASQGGDDVQTVLQLAVDDPELDPYLKLGEPGRFPLKISGSSVPAGVQLVKATKPVEVVAGPAKKTDPVLVITNLEIEGSNASVSYRYDVEGIRGSATLKKGSHGWELVKSRIVEHFKAQ